MLELSFAYLVAAAFIAGLFFLAIGNRRQGWRKRRAVWWEAQAKAASAVFEAMHDAPLQHLDDLSRLQNSLTHQKRPVPEEHLTPSR